MVLPWLHFLSHQYETFRNFQKLIKASVPTKRISQNFDFGDLRSGQFWDLTLAMGKCSYAVFFESTNGKVLFISRYSYIGPLSMTCIQFWPNDPSFRSFEVIWGHIRFLPLTFDRIEIMRWGWSQYVSIEQTHRLICNITYFPRHVTSNELDLRSNSDVDLLRPVCIYFDVSRWEEHDTAKILSLPFSVQKLFVQNHLCKKKSDLSWPL